MREYTPEQRAMLDAATAQLKDRVILFPASVARAKKYLEIMIDTQAKFDDWFKKVLTYIENNYASEFETKTADMETFKYLMRDYFINEYTPEDAYEEERQY